MKRLENDLFPKLGSRPIKDISAPELLSVVRIIEKRGALELANRAMQYCSQIFMFGIATGRVDRNPANDLKGALKTHVKKNFAHLKEIELPEFIEKLEAYDGNLQTKLAVKLLMLTFVRTTELRGATWDEIDLDKAEWRIPTERISENAVLYALYRMGYHNRTTGHGFRHTASTILNESGLFKGDTIERQLAYVQGNKVRGAYNHAEYLPERQKMMQWWAEYLGNAGRNSAKTAISMSHEKAV